MIAELLNRAKHALLWNEEGEPRFHWHWQNLQDRKQDRARGRTPETFPFHGRAWLRLGDTSIGPEWELLSPTIVPAVSLRLNGDGDVQVHAAVPWLASVYLTLESNWLDAWLRRLPNKFRYGFTLFNIYWFEDALFWNVWHETDSWSSRDPRWQDGSICPLDLLLGKQKYESKVLSTHEVGIPMPEGQYPAVIKLTEDSWTRQRFGWPSTVIRRAHIDMEVPIPFQGKGENSWDCGQDACHGLTCPAETIEEAITAMTRTVLRNRRRYDGNVMAKYPAPKAKDVWHG